MKKNKQKYEPTSSDFAADVALEIGTEVIPEVVDTPDTFLDLLDAIGDFDDIPIIPIIIGGILIIFGIPILIYKLVKKKK